MFQRKMISNSLRAQLTCIIEKIKKGETVELKERLLVSSYAKNDQLISNLLKKARKEQNLKGTKKQDGLDKLLFDLNLGFSDYEEAYDPKSQDLGEWFSGAPPWIARS